MKIQVTSVNFSSWIKKRRKKKKLKIKRKPKKRTSQNSSHRHKRKMKMRNVPFHRPTKTTSLKKRKRRSWAKMITYSWESVISSISNPMNK